VSGGGRLDILTFGSPKPDSAYLRLAVYRIGEEDAPKMPLFVELARRAADAGLAITKSSAPSALPTRFGDAESADITLTAADGGSLACVGIRLDAKKLAWQITGFACGGSKVLPRQAVQCILDRFDLNTAGDDRALAAFFAETELHRNPACAGTRMTPAAMQTHLLDDSPAHASPIPASSKTLKH
jgi:hypothetical protein